MGTGKGALSQFLFIYTVSLFLLLFLFEFFFSALTAVNIFESSFTVTLEKLQLSRETPTPFCGLLLCFGGTHPEEVF